MRRNPREDMVYDATDEEYQFLIQDMRDHGWNPPASAMGDSVITQDSRHRHIVHAYGSVWVGSYRGWFSPSPLQPNHDPVILYVPVNGRQYKGEIVLPCSCGPPRTLQERTSSLAPYVLDSRDAGRMDYRPDDIIIISDDGTESLESIYFERMADEWNFYDHRLDDSFIL